LQEECKKSARRVQEGCKKSARKRGASREQEKRDDEHETTKHEMT
jgi:hypothetical protein